MTIINNSGCNCTGTTPSEVSATSKDDHDVLEVIGDAMVDLMRVLGKIVGVVIGVGLFVLGPVICFGTGWIGGWVLKMCFGPMIADGLNLLFGTTRFTPEFIPLACATLATIGRYFKSSQTIRKD